LGSLKSFPQFAKPFCEKCGSATISDCETCGWPIAGIGPNAWMGGGGPYEPPGFCGQCGKAFPWTERTFPQQRDTNRLVAPTMLTAAPVSDIMKTVEVLNQMEREMTEEKKHVFLSYCRDNQVEVKRLRDDLIAAGESVWWDQDIHPGQDWRFEIRKAMQNAYAVVLCLSKESEARVTSGIYPEAMDAINLYREYSPGSIFLIPVRLSACSIPRVEIDGARTLDRLQYQDLFPFANYAAGVQKLLKAIQNTPHYPQ
jgi:hypothetical protein